MSVSIGQQLRQKRQERNISLEQASLNTHIRLHYLEALEEDSFDRLPSKVQTRGFIRSYASFLGLHPETLLSSLEGGPSGVAVETPALSDQAPVVAPTLTPEVDIFKEIGKSLTSQREQLGLSFENIERQTHLRSRYLLALEAGDLESLPSPVQGKGMLQKYATFLGLDTERLLLRFAEGLQARLKVRQAPKKRASARPRISSPRLRILGMLSGDYLFGGVVILVLIGFVVWGIIQVTNIQRGQEPTSSTLPSIAEALFPEVTNNSTTTNADINTLSVLNITPTPESDSVTPQPIEEQIETQTPVPIGITGGVSVSVVVHQRAWMRVIVDGKIEFEGRVLPANAYSFVGKERVELLTSNGAALEVTYNQNNLGMLGIFGEVVNRTFTIEGIVTSTPTITPTATPTIPASPTTTPTSTYVPTLAP